MKKGMIALGMMGMILCMAYNAFGADEFKPAVDFKGSRLAIGYLDSENAGSYPDGSFQMPEAKLRFNLQMAPDMKVVARMNLNNATFVNMDYLYLDYTNLLAMAAPSLKDSLFNPTIRLGRIKLDFGEETWGNNSVEAVTISPSATNTGAYDEAFQIFQALPKDKLGVPVKWALSLSNGNTTSGADNQQSKAVCFKVGVNPINELYVSASYFNSGELMNGSAEMTFAGLATPPTNATRWTRTVTELDIRYDILASSPSRSGQPGKENRLNPVSPAWSDSKAYIRAAYGQFTDDGKDTVAPIVKVTDRQGTYYFLEGCYNATEKLYLATRYSWAGFDKSTLYASLNGAAGSNAYTRISVGAGYRLTDTTHFKVEYVTNTEDMATGAKEPENNQIAILFTTLFK
jgi:hypothetical protein